MIGPLLWHLCQLDGLQIFNAIIFKWLLGHNLCSRAEPGCLLQHSYKLFHQSGVAGLLPAGSCQNVEGNDLMKLMS